jgi:hypothetical protein
LTSCMAGWFSMLLRFGTAAMYPRAQLKALEVRPDPKFRGIWWMSVCACSVTVTVAKVSHHVLPAESDSVILAVLS